MPLFLDTRGRSKIAIGICGRCGLKFPYDELISDPNYPGVYVCQDDLDQLDPYRLPARESEDISLEHPRPDFDISGVGPTFLLPNQLFGIPQLYPPTPWQPNTNYLVGATIWPLSEFDPNVTLPQYWFCCVIAGKSGATPPVWPTNAGVLVGHFDVLTSDGGRPLLDDHLQYYLTPDGDGDGTVSWICLGIYPN